MTPISYNLRYTMNYTFDVSAIASVKVGVITTPSCQLFYGLYQNDAWPESLSTTSFAVQEDGELLLGVGHLPTYGRQEGAASDELGNLVGMSYCCTAPMDKGIS